MIDNLTEAIAHAREVAKENRNKARLFAITFLFMILSILMEVNDGTE